MADSVLLGTFSYNTFIPAGDGSPGVDAFNIGNFTGSFALPSDFPVTDGLTLGSALLTLTSSDSSQQVIDLGDIGPGFLFDGSGNPVVQVPDNSGFASAEFTATLSPVSFTLYDGTTFTSDASFIDVLLLPTTGSVLTADVDEATINATGSGLTIATPEPASALLFAVGLVLIARRTR